MKIVGSWYDKNSSKRLHATMLISDDSFNVEIENGITKDGIFQKLSASSRLGNVERKITLADGSIFATYDNDAVDEAFKKQLKANILIHMFESKIRWVFVALIITLFFTFSFFKWGLPLLSKEIAYALPSKTNQVISEHTLSFLDKYIFKKSDISKNKMQEIRTHFNTKLLPLSQNNDISYKLHFRLMKDSNLSIPNAMALPSGDIILTDKFVQLCQNQEEMDSVLLHEMGHVIHKHSLQMLIESTFISVAAMTIVGDSNGLADMGVGLGSLLISSKYSREYESEADSYAFKHMLIAKIDPIAFSDIMNRMEAYMNNYSNAEEKSSSLEYISSHPETKERVEIARQYSECFQRGLRNCETAKK